MSSVSNVVLVLATDGVVAKGRTAVELVVLDVDTSVNDVSVGVSTGGVVVDVVRALVSLVGDAAETPWCILLGLDGIDVPDLVLFYTSDLVCNTSVRQIVQRAYVFFFSF